jgi:hypothetical protein
VEGGLAQTSKKSVLTNFDQLGANPEKERALAGNHHLWE